MWGSTEGSGIVKSLAPGSPVHSASGGDAVVIIITDGNTTTTSTTTITIIIRTEPPRRYGGAGEYVTPVGCHDDTGQDPGNPA
ncbi:unnamed protein product [Merluccius merluccius]